MMADIITTFTDRKIETVYKIEYITDPKKWSLVCTGKHDAPWELYTVKTLDDLSTAIATYIDMTLRMDVYDAKMFEEILIDGECVQERDIFLPIGFARDVELSVNSKMRMDSEEIHDENKALADENASMTEFLKKHNALESYYNWRNNQ